MFVDVVRIALVNAFGDAQSALFAHRILSNQFNHEPKSATNAYPGLPAFA